MLNDHTEQIQLNGIMGLQELIQESLKDEHELDMVVMQFIDAKVVQKFVEILNNVKQDLEIWFQCTWILINACCCNSQITGQIVQTGVLDYLLNIIEAGITIEDPDEKLLNTIIQSIWIISNIATDSLQHRDICLNKLVLPKILKLLEKYTSEFQLLKVSVWALSRLADNTPAPAWDHISDCLPIFMSILQGNMTGQIVKDALWGISYLSNSYATKIFEAGCLPIMIDYIQNNDLTIRFPALRSIGNLVSLDKESMTDAVLEYECLLPVLFDLCCCRSETIKVYALWTISNIAVGNPDQLARILEKPKYMQILQGFIQQNDGTVKYQASCVIANLVAKATGEQIQDLIENHQYLDCLSILMKEINLDIYERNIIEPMGKIYKADPLKKMTPIFENKGLIEQFRKISCNCSEEMRPLADNIIQEYFIDKTKIESLTLKKAVVPASNLHEQVMHENQTQKSNELSNAIELSTLADQNLSGLFQEMNDHGRKVDAPPSSVATSQISVKTDAPATSTARKIPKASQRKKIQKESKISKKKEDKKLIKRQKSIIGIKKYFRMKSKEIKKKKIMRVRRTNSIKQVIQEAQSWVEGVTDRTRFRKAEIVRKAREMEQQKIAEKLAKKESKVLVNSKKIGKMKGLKQVSIQDYFTKPQKILLF